MIDSPPLSETFSTIQFVLFHPNILTCTVADSFFAARNAKVDCLWSDDSILNAAPQDVAQRCVDCIPKSERLVVMPWRITRRGVIAYLTGLDRLFPPTHPQQPTIGFPHQTWGALWLADSHDLRLTGRRVPWRSNSKFDDGPRQAYFQGMVTIAPPTPELMEKIKWASPPPRFPRGYFSPLITPTRQLLDRALTISQAADS